MILLALENQHKSYVHNKFNEPSITKNTSNIDLNDEIITNLRFIEVNRLPEFGDQLTTKLYVDNVIRNSVDESTLLRLNPDGELKIDEQDSILPYSTLTSPKIIMKQPTKAFVDNKFNDPSIIKNTADVDFTDKILDNVRFIKVNSMPVVGERLTAK